MTRQRLGFSGGVERESIIQRAGFHAAGCVAGFLFDKPVCHSARRAHTDRQAAAGSLSVSRPISLAPAA